jgi:hypothetical protein
VETQIQQLKESDDRSSFDCGVGSMNDWLRNIANQHQKKLVAHLRRDGAR